MAKRSQTKVSEDFATEWASLPLFDKHPGAIPRFLKRHGWFMGRVLANYTLSHPLGMGGTGVIFRAQHLYLKHVTALKLFYPLRATSRELLDATERATRCLKSLQHPGIISLYDLSHINAPDMTSIYLTMELISGSPLHTWSNKLRNGIEATRARLTMALRIAETLHAAHVHSFIGDFGFIQTGILHGDVKPGNILVRSNNSQPVLLDFMIPDLQRAIGRPRHESPLSLQLGDAQCASPHLDGMDTAWMTAEFGTPGYMPPEQELHGVVLPASDVFALGRTFESLFRSELNLIGSRTLSDDLRSLLTNMTASDLLARPDTMKVVCSRLRALSRLIS